MHKDNKINNESTNSQDSGHQTNTKANSDFQVYALNTDTNTEAIREAINDLDTKSLNTIKDCESPAKKFLDQPSQWPVDSSTLLSLFPTAIATATSSFGSRGKNEQSAKSSVGANLLRSIYNRRQEQKRLESETQDAEIGEMLSSSPPSERDSDATGLTTAASSPASKIKISKEAEEGEESDDQVCDIDTQMELHSPLELLEIHKTEDSQDDDAKSSVDFFAQAEDVTNPGPDEDPEAELTSFTDVAETANHSEGIDDAVSSTTPSKSTAKSQSQSQSQPRKSSKPNNKHQAEKSPDAPFVQRQLIRELNALEIHKAMLANRELFELDRHLVTRSVLGKQRLLKELGSQQNISSPTIASIEKEVSVSSTPSSSTSSSSSSSQSATPSETPTPTSSSSSSWVSSDFSCPSTASSSSSSSPVRRSRQVRRKIFKGALQADTNAGPVQTNAPTSKRTRSQSSETSDDEDHEADKAFVENKDAMNSEDNESQIMPKVPSETTEEFRGDTAETPPHSNSAKACNYEDSLPEVKIEQACESIGTQKIIAESLDEDKIQVFKDKIKTQSPTDDDIEVAPENPETGKNLIDSSEESKVAKVSKLQDTPSLLKPTENENTTIGTERRLNDEVSTHQTQVKLEPPTPVPKEINEPETNGNEEVDLENRTKPKTDDLEIKSKEWVPMIIPKKRKYIPTEDFGHEQKLEKDSMETLNKTTSSTSSSSYVKTRLQDSKLQRSNTALSSPGGSSRPSSADKAATLPSVRIVARYERSPLVAIPLATYGLNDQAMFMLRYFYKTLMANYISFPTIRLGNLNKNAIVHPNYLFKVMLSVYMKGGQLGYTSRPQINKRKESQKPEMGALVNCQVQNDLFDILRRMAVGYQTRRPGEEEGKQEVTAARTGNEYIANLEENNADNNVDNNEDNNAGSMEENNDENRLCDDMESDNDNDNNDNDTNDSNDGNDDKDSKDNKDSNQGKDSNDKEDDSTDDEMESSDNKTAADSDDSESNKKSGDSLDSTDNDTNNDNDTNKDENSNNDGASNDETRIVSQDQNSNNNYEFSNNKINHNINNNNQNNSRFSRSKLVNLFKANISSSSGPTAAQNPAANQTVSNPNQEHTASSFSLTDFLKKTQLTKLQPDPLKKSSLLVNPFMSKPQSSDRSGSLLSRILNQDQVRRSPAASQLHPKLNESFASRTASRRELASQSRARLLDSNRFLTQGSERPALGKRKLRPHDIDPLDPAFDEFPRSSNLATARLQLQRQWNKKMETLEEAEIQAALEAHVRRISLNATSQTNSNRQQEEEEELNHHFFDPTINTAIQVNANELSNIALKPSCDELDFLQVQPKEKTQKVLLSAKAADGQDLAKQRQGMRSQISEPEESGLDTQDKKPAEPAKPDESTDKVRTSAKRVLGQKQLAKPQSRQPKRSRSSVSLKEQLKQAKALRQVFARVSFGQLLNMFKNIENSPKGSEHTHIQTPHPANLSISKSSPSAAITGHQARRRRSHNFKYFYNTTKLPRIQRMYKIFKSLRFKLKKYRECLSESAVVYYISRLLQRYYSEWCFDKNFYTEVHLNMTSNHTPLKKHLRFASNAHDTLTNVTYHGLWLVDVYIGKNFFSSKYLRLFKRHLVRQAFRDFLLNPVITESARNLARKVWAKVLTRPLHGAPAIDEEIKERSRLQDTRLKNFKRFIQKFGHLTKKKMKFS